MEEEKVSLLFASNRIGYINFINLNKVRILKLSFTFFQWTGTANTYLSIQNTVKWSGTNETI